MYAQDITLCRRTETPSGRAGRTRRGLARLWAAAVAAVALGAAGEAQAQCHTSCCDLLASTTAPSPGQVVNFTLRVGANPTAGCGGLGLGSVRGQVVGSNAAAPLPASTLSGQLLVGFGGLNIGNPGVAVASPLRLINMDCSRPCQTSPGFIYGGACPPNNSAQDYFRWNFTVPSTALPGQQFTFTFFGTTYWLGAWTPTGGLFCPTLINPPFQLSGCSVTLTIPSIAPPNDPACSCTVVGPGTTSGTTVGATPDGAGTCDGGGFPDVWYCFTPTCTTNYTIDTCLSPSGHDTILTVYTGPCSSLTELACNDDDGGGCGAGVQSLITVGLTAGTQYWIRVASLSAPAPFVLRINPSGGANDCCSNAIPIPPAGVVNLPFNTAGATTDGPGTCPALNDIWYRWTPTTTGVASVDLCGSAYDTYLAVYCGTCAALGSEIICNDDNGPVCGGLASSGTFYAIAGRNYMIRVGGFAGLTGPGDLTVGIVSQPPINDACGGTPIFAGTTYGSTFGASPTPGGLPFCGSSSNTPDVWYTYEAPCTCSVVNVNTCSLPRCGPYYDTVLSVHEGCPTLGTPNFVTTSIGGPCNDDTGGCGNGLQSSVTFNARPCRTYYIRVSGFNGAVGDFAINLTATAAGCPGPSNDTCGGAITLPVNLPPSHALGGNVNAVPFSNCGAGTEGSASCAPSGKDLWYRWTAPCTGPTVIDTIGSRFDTVLSVYSTPICPPPAATEIACNDDWAGGFQSQVSFIAVAGTTYTIRVAGFGAGPNAAQGCGRLSIIGPTPTAGCNVPPPSGNPFGPARWFIISGNSNCQVWKWRISQACCFCKENLAAGPVCPAGTNPNVIANVFAASIAASAPGRFQTIVPAGTSLMAVKARQCAPGLPNWQFEIGYNTTPANAMCTVLDYIGSDPLPTNGPCGFNPFLFELPTSGYDCNHNGIDDAAEIAAGMAEDANADGVPDDCSGCVGDWDNNGEANSNDVVRFLNAWFDDQLNETTIADITHDGESNSNDVTGFLNQWFAGCGPR